MQGADPLPAAPAAAHPALRAHGVEPEPLLQYPGAHHGEGFVLFLGFLGFVKP